MTVRDDWGVSIPAGLQGPGIGSSIYHYKSRRHDQAGIETRIKDICQTRVRCGYRRFHVFCAAKDGRSI